MSTPLVTNTKGSIGKFDETSIPIPLLPSTFKVSNIWCVCNTNMLLWECMQIVQPLVSVSPTLPKKLCLTFFVL